jgi:uncharacterized protein (TIGR02246 family)
VNRRSMLFIPLVLLAVGALLRPTSGAERGEGAEDDKAIRRLLDTGAKVFNDHDAKAWSLIFHPDGRFTNVVGWSAVGREEIEAFHRPFFAETRTPHMPSFRNAVWTTTDDPVIRFLRPDVATLDVRWKQTGALDPEGKDWGERIGLMMWVVTKENGHWGVAAMHNMDLRADLPKETPEELRKK